MKRSRTVILFALAGGLLTACAPEAVVPVHQDAPAGLEIPLGDPTEPAPSLAEAAGLEDVVAAPQPSRDNVGRASEVTGPVTLETISLTLGQFASYYERDPRDINELVEKGWLPYIPPPPAGKKYIWDSSYQVSLK